jgi:hypothetical protein
VTYFLATKMDCSHRFHGFEPTLGTLLYHGLGTERKNV